MSTIRPSTGRLSLDEVAERIGSRLDAAEHLVWYARTPNANTPAELRQHEGYEQIDDAAAKHVLVRCMGIEGLYPEASAQLNGENAEHFHGFNSGAMAMARYVLALLQGDSERAEAAYPDLDA